MASHISLIVLTVLRSKLTLLRQTELVMRPRHGHRHSLHPKRELNEKEGFESRKQQQYLSWIAQPAH